MIGPFPSLVEPISRGRDLKLRLDQRKRTKINDISSLDNHPYLAVPSSADLPPFLNPNTSPNPLFLTFCSARVLNSRSKASASATN